MEFLRCFGGFLSEGWLMKALAGAGLMKRECMLLSGGVPPEGEGLEFPLGQEARALSSGQEPGVRVWWH